MFLDAYLYSSSIVWWYKFENMAIWQNTARSCALAQWGTSLSYSNTLTDIPQGIIKKALKMQTKSKERDGTSLALSDETACCFLSLQHEKEVGVIRCGGWHSLCADTVLHQHAELQFVIPKSVTPPMSKFGLQISPLRKMYLPCDLCNTASPFESSVICEASLRGVASFIIPNHTVRRKERYVSSL